MRYRKWFLAVVFLVGVLAPAISSVHAQAFTSFDVPGSTRTFPTSIKPAGEMPGVYLDSSLDEHGFVHDGACYITSFDVPGPIPGFTGGDDPWSINPASEITGSYHILGGSNHGFVRDRRGTFTTFAPPGETGARSINPAGEITGSYTGAGPTQGFVRDRRGTITSFDPPGSTGT